MFFCLSIRWIIENINPPITGDGIEYFENKGIVFFIDLPIKRKMTATPMD